MTSLPLEIDDLALSTEEAADTLRAIRSGHIDGVVVNAPSGHVVLTFHNPDHVYRTLVEAMGDGAALVTPEGVISYHNPRFAELVTGSSATRLAGSALRDFVAADAAVSVDSMLERGQRGPVRMEVALRPPLGSMLTIQLTASAARVADITVLCVIATDLTEQRAQADLYRNALIGMGARERLISIAGHELRAPIQALVFELGVVLDRVRTAEVSTDPETTTRLAAIHDQALQLAQLVGNLLDIGLLGSDHVELASEEIDLADVVAGAAAHSGDLASSGSSIKLELAPVHGDWDRVRLEQVATNLLSNAAKYGLGKPIRVVVSGDTQRATLIVEDRGIGLAPEAVARLFQPFERIGSVTSATGLGLGLYVSAQIVKAHGGVIRVESAAGAGSRFIIELPRRRP